MTHARRADLWAITSYFNPAGYRSRSVNYRLFRSQIAIPLVTVELSFDGRFELAAGDADRLIQIHGGDVMWQKERLLNVALRSLPHSCDRVAWVDCDVVFGREDWALDTSAALDEWPLVHLFHERHDLPRRMSLEEIRSWNGRPTAESVAFKMAAGRTVPEDFFLPNAPAAVHSTCGLAWASRRDVLERHGFYDACILGTGDRVMLCAALGMLDHGVRAALMNAARAEHFAAWARGYFETVQGRIGCVPGPALHLWHGRITDRRYEERHRLLDNFDPRTDLALDETGCWRWSSDKPEMHASIRRYFEQRNEDRPGAEAVPVP